MMPNLRRFCGPGKGANRCCGPAPRVGAGPLPQPMARLADGAGEGGQVSVRVAVPVRVERVLRRGQGQAVEVRRRGADAVAGELVAYVGEGEPGGLRMLLDQVV